MDQRDRGTVTVGLGYIPPSANRSGPLYSSLGSAIGMDANSIMATGFSAVMTTLPQPGPLQTELTGFRCPSDVGSPVVNTPLADGYMVMMPPMANSTSFGRSTYMRE